MSNPKHSRKRSGRLYVWPPDPEEGEPQHEVPSSTTLIGAGLPKPFLKWWAAGVAAEYAVENVDGWRNLPREDAIDLIKRAHHRYTTGRAALGTEAHDAVEDFLRGEDRFAKYEAEADAIAGPDPDTATLDALASSLDLGVYGYYTAAKHFLTDFDAEPIEGGIEATVYNLTRGYAGTADLFCTLVLPERVGDHEAGERVTAIVDWKTSKRIYPSVAVQLASYAYGEFIGTDWGEELPVPDVDVGIGVRITEEGFYEAVPLEISDRVFAAFIAMKHVAHWVRNTSKVVADKPIKGGKAVSA